MPNAHESPSSPIQKIPFTCTFDCGSRCELVAWVQDGSVVRVDTPPGRPDTTLRPRLVPCARGRAQHRLLSVPERVGHPLRRTGPRGSGEFEAVGWDDALDEVAQHLAEARERRGTASVLHATGAGSVLGRGLHGAAASRRFFSHWGPVTQTSGNASNYCSCKAAEWMLGGRLPGSDRATLLDSRLILLWGMNLAETIMGPNTAHFVAQARDRGAHVILIDPRYTDTGVLADQWVPIRPGTDAALVAALANVMEDEGLVSDFVTTHTTGYDLYRQYVQGESDGVPKTPGWAAPITGVPTETIRQLARDYATVKPAALLPGWGPQRSRFGEQAARAFITLACMTGNVGIRGGSCASVGTRASSLPVPGLPGEPHGLARHIPIGLWAQEILETTLEPALSMAYIVASNLINRTPETNRNAAALSTLDFVVVNEQYMTPTARCADIVLPICTDLERADIVESWGHDSHLFYSRQAVPPHDEARTDYWVFSQLAQRLGFGFEYTQGRTETEWIDLILAKAAAHLDTKTLQDDGILRTDGEPRVALAEFRSDPAGHPLNTPSGRIEIASPEAQIAGLPLIPAHVADDAPRTTPRTVGGTTAQYPLQLITPHSKLRSNSCAHANPWLQQLEPHVLWISSQDAFERGINSGDTVEVRSEFGVAALPARVTERIMPGVTCIYQGTWYAPDADGVDRGGCANTLTSQQESPSGGITTHSARVEVRRAE